MRIAELALQPSDLEKAMQHFIIDAGAGEGLV